jgi:hypothetical protein
VAVALLVSACSAPGTERYGAPLVARAPELSVTELLAAPERFDGAELVLTGTVDEVCLRKGCWMTLTSGERTVRVVFLDYAFFVPRDCAGATARAAGVFRIRETSAEMARHYLEDAGRTDEAEGVAGPVRSYVFVASGVELAR